MSKPHFRITHCLVASALMAIAAASANGDGLFTNKGLDVTQNKTQPAPRPKHKSVADQVQSVKTNEELAALLKSAGYSPKSLTSSVLIRVRIQGKIVPLLVSISNGGESIWLMVRVVKLQSETELPAAKLLALLHATYKYNPYFFSYETKYKMLLLGIHYPNRNVTAQTIQQRITGLIALAERTASLWKPAPRRQAARPGEVAQPRPVAAPQHVGRWSGRVSGGVGYVLDLKADGRFVLENTRSGSKKVTTGRYTERNGLLTMVVTGGKRLEATIAWQGRNSFIFKVRGTPAGQTGVMFTRS